MNLTPGEKVVVHPAPDTPADPTGVDVSYLRKPNIDLDADLLRQIIEDRELGIENF